MTVDDRPEPLNLPPASEGLPPGPRAAIAPESVAMDPWDVEPAAGTPTDEADSNWPEEPDPTEADAAANPAVNPALDQTKPVADPVIEAIPEATDADPAPLQLPEPRRPMGPAAIALEPPRDPATAPAIAPPTAEAIAEQPPEAVVADQPPDAMIIEPVADAPPEPPHSPDGERENHGDDGNDSNDGDDLTPLRRERDRLQAEIEQTRADLGRLVQTSLSDLEYRRQRLIASIEKLERRRDRVRQEMQTTFAGASQGVAARVQGFKDYLVGSLQELVEAAEELQLLREPEPAPSPVPSAPPPSQDRDRGGPPRPQFAERAFQDDNRKIQQILDRYRNRPDYYGPPWRLRRTFEPIHAERVSSWFFDQGGRGAIRALGSRLQNILVTAAAASILRALYGDRLRVLVLSDTPERLGDWRRGLQDCLGISRSDFGPDRGVTLFDAPEPLAQKAARIQERGDLPFIIIDEGKGSVSLTLLQFPLWLAIAPDPQAPGGNYDGFYER